MGMMGSLVVAVLSVLAVKGYYHYYGDAPISPLRENIVTPPALVGVVGVGQYICMGGYTLVTVEVPELAQRLVHGLKGCLRGYVDIPSSSGDSTHPSIPRVVSHVGLVGVGVGGGDRGGGYQASDSNSAALSSSSSSAAAAAASASASAVSGSIKENNGSSPLKRSNSIASLLSSLPMMALEKVTRNIMLNCITLHNIYTHLIYVHSH